MAKRRKSKCRFNERVVGLDGKCMNKHCNSETRLTAHHIVYKSHVRDDDIGNGITLCWKCHKVAHEGYTNPQTKVRTTAHEFVANILDSWIDSVEYRWDVAHDKLRKRIVLVA